MEPTTVDRPIPSGGAAASTPATTSPATPPAPAHQAPAPVSAAPVVLSREVMFSENRPIKTVDVEIPGLGIARVSSLTQGAWEDLNNRHEGEDGKTNTSKGYMSEAVASALVGADGRYMFPEDYVEGGKQVKKLGLQAVAKLFAAVANESGLTQGARETLGKGSEPTLSGAG